jgi:hypothetical protein
MQHACAEELAKRAVWGAEMRKIGETAPVLRGIRLDSRDVAGGTTSGHTPKPLCVVNLALLEETD